MRNYIRTLIPYLKNQKFLALVVLLIIAFQVFLVIGIQVAYKEIFDAVAKNKDYAFILYALLFVAIASCLRILALLTNDFLTAKVCLTLFNRIREALFSNLQWLPARFYQKSNVGDIVTRYSLELQRSEVTTRQTFPLVISSMLNALFSFSTLFYFKWQLALIAFLTFPSVLIFSSFFIKRANAATRKDHEATTSLSASIEEVGTQHLLLQAFNLQEKFLKQFKLKLKSFEKDFIRGFFFRSLISRTGTFGLLFSEVIVLSLGAFMAFHDMISLGTLFIFFSLIWNVSGSIVIVTNQVPTLIETGISLRRLNEFLSEKTDEPKIVTNAKLTSLKKEISFQNVVLRHDNHEVISQVSLKVPAATSVALVGATGSGKTTLLSLLMGFYPVTEGQICMDGLDLSKLDPRHLRETMGIVFQHNPLFNMTIRDNIRIGKLEATDEEVIAAAKQAEIHDFITTLAEGYETHIQEYGINLSGGQKQRIALARVFLRNPSILLLDEPTSSLDPATEAWINKTIEKLSLGKTLILATHRLKGLTHFGKIVFLEKGKIVEEGRHDELLARKGSYFNLWTKQEGVFFHEEEKKAKVSTHYLRSLFLFKETPEELLQEIANEFVTEWVDEDKTVFEKGSCGDKFYLIVRGKVEIQNPPTRIALLQEGDFFGEMALLKGSVHTKQAVTKAHCVFLTLYSFQFQSLINKDKNLKEEFEKLLKNRNLYPS